MCQSQLQQTTFINTFCFPEKIRLDVSYESSARQALFSSKDERKKLKCRLLQIFVWCFKGLTKEFLLGEQIFVTKS